jgi:hypothetical protein
MEMERKKMLIKYWEDKYSIGHMALFNILDPARLVIAQRIDVHGHEDQQLNVALKYERSQDCHLFSNESYLYPKWQNPAWRLSNGTYRLRVTLYYERGRTEADFRLRNIGDTRDGLSLELWQP